MRRATDGVCGFVLALLVIASLGAALAAGQAAPQNPQPTYRTGVMLVPVDVRVIDNKTGLLVTDLKQEDFVVFENDVRQEILHFALQSLGPLQPGEAAAGQTARPGQKLTPRVVPLSVVPQTDRVFLIVLGRGRLAGPAKALEAVAHFVRSHLLPSDQVAVFAYDRATSFTTDHEQAAQVIDRFKTDNDAIAAEIEHQVQGLAGLYGSRGLPASVQARINRVFKGTGTLPYSPVGSAEADRTPDKTKRDEQRRVDAAVDSVIASGRTAPQSAERLDDPVDAGNSWASFDAFVGRSLQTLEDTANLYGIVAYMQRIEGEKHLVFVTPRGLNLRTLEAYQDISATAADARVALDVVQSGFGDVLQAKAMRSLSEDTGGVASIADYGQAAFDRLDLTTRSGYLIGYYPSNRRTDGKYRAIRVTVNRPGVTVVYRHGYRASDEIPSFDRRAYLTRYRLEAAAAHPDEIEDIAVKVHASVAAIEGRFEATIDARVDPSRLGFAVGQGVHAARLDIAVVAMGAQRQAVAGKTQTVDVKIPDAAFVRAQKDGITFSVRLPVPSGTRYVRFIVYDYASDLLGSAGSSVF